MPVIRQKMIYRADLKANPDRLYLFGDNWMRRGYGGQAAAMRGEKNAIGVRTKWHPSMEPIAFFSDDDYALVISLISNDLEPAKQHLRDGGTVVIPSDGLGTGLSRLTEKAPQIAAWLDRQLSGLK